MNITDIPNEIIIDISRYLDVATLFTLQQTSHHFYALFSPIIWHDIALIGTPPRLIEIGTTGTRDYLVKHLELEARAVGENVFPEHRIEAVRQYRLPDYESEYIPSSDESEWDGTVSVATDEDEEYWSDSQDSYDTDEDSYLNDWENRSFNSQYTGNSNDEQDYYKNRNDHKDKDDDRELDPNWRPRKSEYDPDQPVISTNLDLPIPRSYFLDFVETGHLNSQLENVTRIVFDSSFFENCWEMKDSHQKAMARAAQVEQLLRAMKNLRNIVLLFGKNISHISGTKAEKLDPRVHSQKGFDIWLKPFLDVYGNMPSSPVTFEIHTENFKVARKLASNVNVTSLTNFLLHNEILVPFAGKSGRMQETSLQQILPALFTTKNTLRTLHFYAHGVLNLVPILNLGIQNLELRTDPQTDEEICSIECPATASFEHLQRLSICGSAFPDIFAFLTALHKTGTDLRDFRFFNPDVSVDHTLSSPHDFNTLPKLESLGYNVNGGSPNIFAFPHTIRKLELWDVDFEALTLLASLTALEALEINLPILRSTDHALLALFRTGFPALRELDICLGSRGFRLSRVFLQAFFAHPQAEQRLLRVHILICDFSEWWEPAEELATHAVLVAWRNEYYENYHRTWFKRDADQMDKEWDCLVERAIVNLDADYGW
ncbi:hypothetical protein EDC01DRAFT_62755 [Geopyxis carbonaria]|nr:hypothetical protein EDC01DRAFT_62755 [Geopyxis carbonaria]